MQSLSKRRNMVGFINEFLTINKTSTRQVLHLASAEIKIHSRSFITKYEGDPLMPSNNDILGTTYHCSFRQQEQILVLSFFGLQVN